jgi:HD-like signal output (HDOD) protein
MEQIDQARLITEKLLQRMDADVGFAGFPAVAGMIGRMDDDDPGSARRLPGAILSDIGITLRLLRLANASSRGSHNIATIDQAITVLGLSAVKAAIAALKPIDSFADKNVAAHLQAEVIAACFSGALAATVTRHNGARYSAQEAHVCAALHSVGRIAALAYLPDEVAQSHLLQAEKNLSEDDALVQTLGQTFETLNGEIAKHWNFPDVLENSAALTEGKAPPRAAANAESWYQLSSLFAHKVTHALFRLPAGRDKAAIIQEMNYFHQALSLKNDETQQWIDDALVETDNFLSNLMHPINVAQARVVLRKSSEKVLDSLSSQDSLNRGKSDEKKPIELIHQALRMIHSEYEFDFTLLCLPSGSAGLVGVSGVGRNANQVTPKFRCAGPKLDIFQVVMSKKIDLYVADVRAPSYSKLMPEWFGTLVGAPSFMVWSLVHDGKFLGLLYGDYSKPHPTQPKEKTEGSVAKWRQQLVDALQANKPGAH